MPEVREEIFPADLVSPSLDAVSPDAYQLINRPVAGIEIGKIIEGLIAFRKSFSGQLWLEIFIIPGINNTNEAIEQFKTVIPSIAPDRIQLNTLDRPGTETTLTGATPDQLQRVKRLLFPLATEIIAATGTPDKPVQRWAVSS
jgi:wyosine [tRNA(Phe)-imidazoG37] synthetase (radical SAM superfamily)